MPYSADMTEILIELYSAGMAEVLIELGPSRQLGAAKYSYLEF